MIFVTVGTQFPFDRLVRVVDEWAGRVGRRDVVAQIGPSDFAPKHLKYQEFVSPVEFADYMNSASLVISHAGMGTILSALGLGKPILVMPRLARYNEHRNDHQLATARRLHALGRIPVAMDEQQMSAQLDALTSLSAGERIAPYANDELLMCVRRFIES